MSTIDAPRARRAGTMFLPPDRRALLEDALRCIVDGRPLPAAVRPAATTAPFARTVADGLAAICRGPAAFRALAENHRG